jgi:hypothetical protein
MIRGENHGFSALCAAFLTFCFEYKTSNRQDKAGDETALIID